jgi:hypothetical protein
MNNICTNCFATESVQWRKSQNGERLCNKCGIYQIRHKKNHRLHIVIKKRLHPRKQQNPRRANYE